MNHGIGYQFKIINDRIKARADADLKTHDLTLTRPECWAFWQSPADRQRRRRSRRIFRFPIPR